MCNTKYKIDFEGVKNVAPRKELFTMWLEGHDYTWFENLVDGSFTIVTTLTPVQLEVLREHVDSRLPGATLAVVATDATPIEASRTAVAELTEQTWYQYRARMRAVTRHDATTDRHDEVLAFTEESGKFTYCIQRVQYRETVKRDVTVATLLEMVTVTKDGAKWIVTRRSVPTIQAPDHLNFGSVHGEHQVPQKYLRALDTDRLQVKDPGMVAALSIFARFPNLVSE